MARPLQVYLAESELERLDAWSRQRGWTKSQAVRAAIRALTRPTRDDPLLAASGMIDSLPADLSEHFDHHLGETFVAEKASAYRRVRRRPARPPVRR